MIDIHCHLLPGIDDGPNILEESLQLCRIAAEDGISHAIVTPHIHPGRWNNTRAIIQPRLQELKICLLEEDIPLQLGFAGEVRLSDQLMLQLDMEEIPFYGEVNGFKIMLLEFPHSHIIPGSEKMVRWLLANNIRPLLAHPERNKQVMRDPGQLDTFVEAGCWLQLTAGSLLGKFGEQAKSTALSLLADDRVAVIASDGHNAKARPPVLREAYTFLCDLLGGERATQLVQSNPAKIVSSQFSDL